MRFVAYMAVGFITFFKKLFVLFYIIVQKAVYCICFYLILCRMYTDCNVYVFLLLCMFHSVCAVTFCYSVYCVCVNVYCTAANGCQPNCS